MTTKEFIALAKNNKINPLQITTFINKSVETKILNEKQKSLTTTNNTSYSITAKINNKDIKMDTNYLDESIIRELIVKANNIETDYKEVYIEDKKEINDEAEELDFDISKQIEEIIIAHKKKDKSNYITNIETDFQLERITKNITNSYGLDITSIKNICAIYTEVTTKNNNDISNISDVLYKTTNDIDIDSFISKLIDEAVSSINKVVLESKKYNVILSTTFTSKILGAFASLLSKEDVRKKYSCLADKLDKKIFSDKITIIEDPTNKSYPSYNKFDNEGTETYKKTIVENGVLKMFLYNNKEAIIDNKKSTGNGYGSIDVRNIYIVPGKKTEKELLKDLNNGLYIKDYQSTGGVVLNPTTGAISVQITGVIVKNGIMVDSFETCILTTTIFELLSNIIDISNTIEFKRANSGAPSLHIKDMSISSN